MALNAVRTPRLEVDDTIFDCIANLVIAVDHRGHITIFNHTCERLFGLTADQAIGKLVSQVIPYTGLIKVLKTGKAHIGRKFVLGNALFIVNRTPIIKDNRIIGAIGVAQEITELHQLASELEAVKDRKNSLESIFEHTNEGYISISREGYVNFVNPAMARLLKATPEKLLNQHITEILPETKVHFFQINGGSQQNELLKLADRNVLVSSFPVFKNGKVESVINKVIYQDIDKLAALALKSESAGAKRNDTKSRYTLDDIIGSSKAMSKLKEIVHRVARGPSTVLITGESGTGKELLAHALHAHSPRAGKPFVKVNCAAIPENLLESELFGYREGAFTGSRKGGQIGKFELANKGTIFLDEIGDMPLSMQAKVLRVLQEKEIERLGDRYTQKVDVRIIAATNRDLPGLIAEGRFRRDLYYRLNVVNLNIPPLRERKEDIEELVAHFITKYNREFSLQINKPSRDVMELFECYNWPGNVRELKNIIERAFNLVEEDTIEMKHLPHYLLEYGGVQGKEQKAVNLNKSLPALLECVEKEAIMEALDRTGGNKLQSAKLLGISRAWLYKKIRQYQIE